jgi:transcriptional regulator with XRE-family HTH domain
MHPAEARSVEGVVGVNRISEAIGEALRRARKRRGLTLHDVDRISRGRFKPSSVGSYERGTRTISAPLLVELSTLYGVPPDRLLSEALAASEADGIADVIIDLTRLPQLHGQEAKVVVEFVERVQAQRRGPHSDVITLRTGDLQFLSSAAGIAPRTLLDVLTPALQQSQTSA